VTQFVLDCSMTMTWCFEDEARLRSSAVLKSLETEEAVVPSVWPLEVANVLAVCERSGRITTAEASRFLGILAGLPIAIDEQTSQRAFVDVLMLARTQRVSAYDAAYLELALRGGYPLASLDGRLNAAAGKLGILSFNG
jgi:predicted nucleic acid-binding protein